MEMRVFYRWKVSTIDEKSTGKEREAPPVFSPLESGREPIQWCVYARHEIVGPVFARLMSFITC